MLVQVGAFYLDYDEDTIMSKRFDTSVYKVLTHFQFRYSSNNFGCSVNPKGACTSSVDHSCAALLFFKDFV